MIYTEENFAIAKFAAREEGRYAINGVHITPEYTQATNGRSLIRVEALPDRDCYIDFLDKRVGEKGIKFAPFVFPSHQAQSVAQDLKRCHRQKDRFASAWITGEKRPRVNVLVDGSDVHRSPRQWEQKFPTVDQIFKQYKDGIKASFSSLLLAEMFGFMAKTCEPLAEITISENGPLRISTKSRKDHKITAVVMNCQSSQDAEKHSTEAQAIAYLRARGYTVEKKDKGGAPSA